jgi:hypothetical protein
VRGLTVPSWLDALKAGRCVATNGPLLTLTVDGKEPGAVLALDKPRALRIEATALGRHNFEKLQLVHNGKVIATEPAVSKDGVHSARLGREVRIDGPGWFAVRIDSQTRNELDRQLYAHTSPVYVEVAGQRVFDVEAARSLIRELEEAQVAIRARGKFRDAQALDNILTLYQQAIKDLANQASRRGK